MTGIPTRPLEDSFQATRYQLVLKLGIIGLVESASLAQEMQREGQPCVAVVGRVRLGHVVTRVDVQVSEDLEEFYSEGHHAGFDWE